MEPGKLLDSQVSQEVPVQALLFYSKGPPVACREITVHLRLYSFLSITICLLKVRLVVTNPAVRRGTDCIRILDLEHSAIVDI